MTIAALTSAVGDEIAERYPGMHRMFLEGLDRLTPRLEAQLPRLRAEHATVDVECEETGGRDHHCQLVIGAAVSVAERIFQDPGRYAGRFRFVLRRQLGSWSEPDVEDCCQEVLRQLLEVTFSLAPLASRIGTLDGVRDSFEWTELAWQPALDSSAAPGSDLHASYDAWLRSMCETLGQRVVRRRQREALSADWQLLVCHRRMDPDTQVIEEDRMLFLRQAIERVDEPARTIFERLLDGDTPTAIQKTVPLTHGTYYRELAKGLSRLNEILRARRLSADDLLL